MTPAKPQIEWVNIAKGLAMIAVVMGHVGYAWPECKLLSLRTMVVGWHVPVFFLIAGFFIKEERLTRPVDFIKGKVRSLYRLLLYFYIPAVLLHNVFLRIGFYDAVTSYGGKFMVPYGAMRTLKELVLSVCFAGREPILGAMWFVYVLFLALCAFSILSFVLKKWVKDERTYEWVRLVLLLLLCIASCSASRIYGLTVPRFNNALTALWLIYVGYKLRNRWHVDFQNAWIGACSVIVVAHLSVMGGVTR